VNTASIEKPVNRMTRYALAGVLLAGGLYIGTAEIADSYAAHRCDDPPAGLVRNHYVSERPTCDHGTWKIVASSLRPTEYGWNCYYDGDGVCGDEAAAYADVIDFCRTREDDGYTMCQDGRVFYLDSTGARLWPVLRDPDGSDDTYEPLDYYIRNGARP
jgi:hypothetical protein